MHHQPKAIIKPTVTSLCVDPDESYVRTTIPEQLSLFKEMDSDDETYAAAFGTTVSNGDYMDQYQKHNRVQSLVSPSAFKICFSESSAFMVDKNLKPKLNSNTSNKSVTANHMTQAARYYSNLQRGLVTVADTSTHNEHSLNNFKIPSYSSAQDNFESSTLQYGQAALYDKINKQYFADIESNKRHVFVNLHVNRLTEIDTVRESFRCQFWISFSWLPTHCEWLSYKDHQLTNRLTEWKPSWVPIIAFPELMNEWKFHYADKPNSGKFSISCMYSKDDEKAEIGYDPESCLFIRCKLECDMTFSNGFLLLNFPVDCQDLPISMHEISGECIFVAEQRKRSFASIHTTSSVMEEWQCSNMMIEIGQLEASFEFAQLKVRLKMQRRFEVYLWNVVFFMALISGLTLCSFAVEDVDLGERLAIIITLLLTSVAYQSSVFMTLPNVPYLTLLDKYIVTSFVFMTLVTIETAMLGTQYVDNDEHNRILFVSTAIAFIGYHVLFVFVAINKQSIEQRKLHMTSNTMLKLYSKRERIDVDWKSGRDLGTNWKVYTQYPNKLIT
eukprot:86449_1